MSSLLLPIQTRGRGVDLVPRPFVAGWLLCRSGGVIATSMLNLSYFVKPSFGAPCPAGLAVQFDPKSAV